MSPDKATPVDIQTILEEVSFVALQYPEGVFSQNIIKVRIFDNAIYILESSSTGNNYRLYSFEMDGSFRFVIDKEGSGPGEYPYIYDFDVNASHIVLSIPSFFLYYHRLSGEYDFVRDSPQELFTQMVAFPQNDVMVLPDARGRGNRSKSLIKVYDFNKARLIYEGAFFEEHALKVGHSYRYQFYAGDSLSVVPMYVPAVYRLQNREGEVSFYPTYRFDFGRFWIEEEKLASSFNKREEFFGTAHTSVHTIDVYETPSYIYLRYSYLNDPYALLVRKADGSQVDISGFEANSIGWMNRPVEVFGEHVVGLLQPVELDFDSNAPIHPELRKLVNPDVDEGQPILVFARFGL